MERVIRHRVEYDFDGRATVEEIAASLIASAALMDEAISLISICAPGLRVEGRSYSVSLLRHDSPLLEEIRATITLVFQEHIVDLVPGVIETLTGSDIPEQYEGLVNLLALTVALKAAAKAKEYLYKDSGSANITSITNITNNFIIKAGGQMNVSPERLDGLLQGRMDGQHLRKMQRASKDYFSPAQSNRARKMSIGKDLEIPKSVLKELPTRADAEAYVPQKEMEGNPPLFNGVHP